MGNRIRLKDVVLIALLLGVGLILVLGMVQDDRRWSRLNEMHAAIEAQNAQLGQLLRRLDARDESARDAAASLRAIEQLLRGHATTAPASAPPAGAAREAGSSSTPGDESWARPGVPITRPPARGAERDPRSMPGYAEGGSVTEVFEGQMPKVVPLLYADDFGRRVTELVTEFLADYDHEGRELRGVLADAWQYDPAGMWLRARIRPGARFSDGSPVTAEDVRFTVHDYLFNPEIEAERFRAVYAQIRKVTPVAPDVVEFEFAAPQFNNEQAALRLPILPRSYYAAFSPSEINAATGLLAGSGPYMLPPGAASTEAQWRPGRDLVLVRNEHYWGPLPAVRELRFRIMTDPVARLAAFESGAADIIRPSFPQYARFKDDPAFAQRGSILAWANIRSGYAFIAWNCGERNGRPTPFADPRVRLAMTHLLDRDRIRREVYEDLGVVATGPFNPFSIQSDPSITPWPFDPARAKTLLAEAGWTDADNDGVLENARGDEFAFEFTTAVGSAAGEKLAAYLKDQCAAAGIRCTTRVIDWSIFQATLKSRDFDALTMQWAPSEPESDPVQTWHSKSILNQGDNMVQWSNPRADALIDAARLELDRTKRAALWHQLHRVIHDEQPYTFLCNVPWLRFVSTRVANVNMHPMGLDYLEWFVPGGGTNP